MEGSTKIIIDSSQGVVNRLDYDTLGNIRNQTAAPQVELLWNALFYISDIEEYLFGNEFSDPKIGTGFITKTSQYPILAPKVAAEVMINNPYKPTGVIPGIIPNLPIPLLHLTQDDWDQHCKGTNATGDSAEGTVCCVGRVPRLKGTCWRGSCLTNPWSFCGLIATLDAKENAWLYLVS